MDSDALTDSEGETATPLPAQYYGQAILDRCPLHNPLDFSQLVTLRPLGALPEDSWTSLMSRMPLIKSVALPSDTQSQFQLTHPCAVLSVWLPNANTMSEAISAFENSAGAYVLAVALWVNAPCEPLATLIVDTATNDVFGRFWAVRPLPITLPAGRAPDYFEKVMPGLLDDPRMRLLVAMYRDFLLEPQDSPAIVKGWTLLEVAATNEKGKSKLDQVRKLCERVNVATEGALLRQSYEASGRDLIKATFLHRNCIAHDGWCNPKSQGCMESPCRNAQLLRLDLQMFLGGFLSDYLGVNSWVSIGPDGISYRSPDGAYQSDVGSGNGRVPQ